MLTLSLCLSYSFSRKHKFAMPKSDLDRLMEIAGEMNKLKKHEVEIEGRKFEWYSKPMTIEDIAVARSKAKDKEDDLEQAVRMFISRALDANGKRKYGEDYVTPFMKVLPLTVVTEMLGAMNAEEDSDEVDMKSGNSTVKA